MDPFLEGQVWEEFHHLLVPALHEALVPLVRPRYVVRMQERVYLERPPEEASRTIQPDVTLTLEHPPREQRHPGGGAAVAAPVTVPLLMPQRRREPFLEIRARDGGEVVTVIELLSPTNKRRGSQGREEYLAKHEAVLLSRAHLLELDLLRGGQRLPRARPLPPGDFYVVLSRTERRPDADVWPLGLRAPLPSIPVPLSGSDPGVSLDLQRIFERVYDRAGYDYSLDYGRDPVPALTEADSAWARELLSAPRG
jgi:hypothetical protein